MRNFADSAGIEWTVFEVKRQGNEAENWAYLPSGFRAGWLCFESTAAKRRLSPVPEHWKTFGVPDLERMLERASLVVRGKRDLALGDLNIGESTGEDSGLQA